MSKFELGKSHWDHQARAVLAAISEAGAVEWGVLRPGVGTQYADEKHATESAKFSHEQGFAATVVSRFTGPWTAVEG